MEVHMMENHQSLHDEPPEGPIDENSKYGVLLYYGVPQWIWKTCKKTR